MNTLKRSLILTGLAAFLAGSISACNGKFLGIEYNFSAANGPSATTQQSVQGIQQGAIATQGVPLCPTSTPGVQPTPYPICTQVVQPTEIQPLCPPTGSSQDCKENLLSLLEETRDDSSNQIGWQQVGEPCLSTIEYCINNGIQLSQQRLADLGVYSEMRSLGGAPGDWDVQKIILNETPDGAKELYVQYSDGQQKEIHKVNLTPEMWNAYLQYLNTESNEVSNQTVSYVENTIRDNGTFTGDVLSQGYTLDELANALVQSPDAKTKGYDLPGILDALNHGIFYVWAPNKIKCADGSNSPGMLTIIKADDTGNFEVYPLSFPDDKLLDEAIRMSLPDYGN